MLIRLPLLTLLLTLGTGALAQELIPPNSEECVSCHDFGPESPVHTVLEGSHASEFEQQANGGQRGCPACHGPSVDHARSPTRVQPNVSFGPRWTASTAAQDQPCLDCHEENAAAHWGDSLHMLNDLTCVTCHDIHTGRDKVLFAAHQSDVCTTCHKVQKLGIHGLEEHLDENPVCTSCHNPHDNEDAAAEMLANRSEGCRVCHDLVQMAAPGASSAKAQNYHKVMVQPDRTCLDCHEGISHAPADAAPPLVPEAVTERQVTLFIPGQSDSDWLLTEHPGSQPLRQGRNCQQCHRGEEASMGAALNDGTGPDSRDLQVAFSRHGDKLVMDLSWRATDLDTAVSVMWGDAENRLFQRGGCFAACHSDMPGMSRDRGQQTGKYLAVSRSQQVALGTPPLVRDAGDLARLREAGQFVEVWRVDLASGKLQTASMLETLDWRDDGRLEARASREKGRWRVRIARPLGHLEGMKTFSEEQRLTFGIALSGIDNPGGRHWVSLPMTLGLDAQHTDFRAE